jgi:hypothetical protein
MGFQKTVGRPGPSLANGGARPTRCLLAAPQHQRISELIIPRVIDVPQTAVVMDACDYFALLISCSCFCACVSLAWEPVLQRNFESPINDPLQVGVAAPTLILSQLGLDA